jgi:IclR family transcriptional regulator, KDG regulon repressor
MRQIVDKIGTILSRFSLERTELGVTELSKELCWPKSTVSEILASLAGQGFVERTRRGRFRPGWRFFELNQILLEATPLVREARKAMQELVERHGESSHLMVLDRHQAVIVEKVQASLATQVLMSRVGLRQPAHGSACGKMLLALQPWESVREMFDNIELKPFTPATITDLRALELELDRIRREDLAFDHEEIVPGLTCVAAPIRNEDGKPIAAMSISIPSYRFTDEAVAYVDMIRGAARRVSGRLGYSGRPA